MELYKASQQWATRPDDERYWTPGDMYESLKQDWARSAEANVQFGDIRAQAIEGEVQVVGKHGTPAKLTHWAFSQVAQRAGGGAGYLRTLAPTLAAQCLNYHLSRREDTEVSKLLLRKSDEGSLLRAALTTDYQRVWNFQIIERLLQNLPQGWKVPPARPSPNGVRTRQATEEDVLTIRKGGGGLAVNVGDLIGPAGLYASDHDMFVFMVNEENMVDDGAGGGLGRGFFLWNSEVGAKSFGFMSFLYDAVCGNHIVWGAKDVQELRVRHVGKANARVFQGLSLELRKYADSSADESHAQIVAARRYELGATQEDVIDTIMAIVGKKKIQGLTAAKVERAYELAEASPRYGNPNTMWAMVNGVTELSQKTTYTDERVALDRAAGKLLQVVF